MLYNVTGNGKGHKYILDKNLKGGKGAATERCEVADSAYIDGKVGEASVRVLREIAGNPFFLAIGLRRPHLPFTAPDKYNCKVELAIGYFKELFCELLFYKIICAIWFG